MRFVMGHTIVMLFENIKVKITNHECWSFICWLMPPRGVKIDFDYVSLIKYQLAHLTSILYVNPNEQIYMLILC